MAKKTLLSGQKWFLKWFFSGFGGQFVLKSVFGIFKLWSEVLFLRYRNLRDFTVVLENIIRSSRTFFISGGVLKDCCDSIFSSQPNTLGHMLKLPSRNIIWHIFILASHCTLYKRYLSWKLTTSTINWPNDHSPTYTLVAAWAHHTIWNSLIYWVSHRCTTSSSVYDLRGASACENILWPCSRWLISVPKHSLPPEIT